MNSKELNEEISKICDNIDLYEAFGGKSIPYIGWYWREVNFDRDDYYFGILPDDKPRLGFMENNKWDYSYHYCPPEDWKEIKLLLEKAINNLSHETLKAVNDKIQSLISEA